MSEYVAGIVSYNPDMERLESNVKSIIKQVKKIFIVDNGSENVEMVKKAFLKYDSVELICNTENEGIATALNQVCQKALNEGYLWCLLLDQDSICSDNIIIEYSKHIGKDNIAMLSPYIVDEYKITLEQYRYMNLPAKVKCNYAITSGSFVDLSVWREVGGFWGELFIDGVDTEYSYNLRMHGYNIFRINSCYMLHQQGNQTEKTHIYRIHKDESGKKTIKPAFRFNYSMIRWYYMARNNLIIIKKYRKLNGVVRPFFNYMIRFFSVIMIEHNKRRVLCSILKGFVEGINYKITPAEKINIS